MGPSRTTLTAEQRAELEQMHAESLRPEARAEEEAARALILREYPPAAAPDPEVAAALARLRLERERRGLSLADLSERTGMDRAALSRLETGKTNPTVATLARVAAALGARLEWNLVDVAGGE